MNANNEHKILVVDDDRSIREILANHLIERGYKVTEAEDGVQAIKILQSESFDVIISDLKMPRVNGIEVLKFAKENYPDTEVIMMTGYGEMQVAIDAMKMKAYDFLIKPFSFEEICIRVEHAIEKRKLEIDNKAMRLQLKGFRSKDQIIGKSKALIEILELAKRVAVTSSNVLITGESGTGKELMAYYIHNNSMRKEKPFVAINCASIPHNLMESELFGHEKGAYTDAYQLKQGLVEIAKNGSLFLDEIGDVNIAIQPKLLRFIETGEFRRIGGTHNFYVDVRIIAATNKNLKEEVINGNFREDLFYRLDVVSIDMPPLRNRKEDIPLLVDYFIQKKISKGQKKTFSDSAMNFLMDYDWPGNIRELEHVVESALIFSKSDIIHPSDIPIKKEQPIKPILSNILYSYNKTDLSLEEMEKIHITEILKKFNWNQTQAAKALKISPKTLYTKIRRYNISKE
ncbi:MAG TPA: sigma-54 dependent transcriptional regulator [Ignavibacteria bacterium]|jgi:DNA-binding NtrC family response regulator